jgi:membrane protein YdbS with pleckstrin-like domain
MNQRTVLGIVLVVFALSMLTQCTVQKRLYRKGYYVSFHKTPKSSGEPKATKQLADVPVSDTIQLTEQQASEFAEPQTEMAESHHSSTDKIADEPAASLGMKPAINLTKEHARSLIKQVISKSTKHTEPVAKKQSRPARTIIIVTMLLLLAASIGLIYLGLVTLNPIPAISGAFLALGAIVGLFVGLAVEDAVTNHDQVEEKKKVEREKQQKLSEEEWTELKQKQFQKAVRTTILLLVLFFGVSLFALAVGEPMPLIAITGAMFLIFLAFVWGTYKAKRKDDPVMNTES